MTIHFEGLDLAGKSTVCRRLMARLPGSRSHYNTLLENNPVCLAADQLRKTGTVENAALGALYYGALLHDIDAYHPPAANDIIIQDSTILLRSLAFHSIIGNKELADLFQSRLAVHPSFGKSFFLTCDPEVRRNRFKGRISRGNDAPEDHLLLTNPEQFFAMEAELRRLATTYFNATILDTSGLEDEKSSNQLLDRILAEIPTAVAVEIEPDLLWQRGAKMAARFHLGQLRKDGKTPYIAHPMRVSLTLQRIFGVSDPSILTAALLHDLIEDTTADYDDIQEACGDDIARMVATLTKNSCLPEEQREPAFHEQLLAGDWRTKLVKIADVYDNLCDSRESLAKVNVWKRAKLALDLAGENPRLARAAQALRELMASFPEDA